MQIHDISVSQLIEYKNNPRYNDGAFKNISACALGKKKTAYGFVWCYYE